MLTLKSFLTPKRLLHGVEIMVIGLVVIQSAIALVNYFNQDRPILGQSLQRASVSLRSTSELKAIAVEQISRADKQPAVITAGDFTSTVTARQLGARYDTNVIQQKLVTYGRQGPWWQRLWEQDQAALGLHNEVLGYPQIDRQTASTYLAFVNGKMKRAPQNSQLVADNGKLAASDDKSGTRLNTDAALEQLMHFDPTKSSQLKLSTDAVPPTVSKNEVQALLPKAQQIAATPLTLRADGTQTTLTTEQIAGLLRVSAEPDPKKPGATTPTITFDDTKMNAYLDTFAAKVEQPAQPAVVRSGRQVAAGRPGTHVDGQHAKVALMASLQARTLPKKQVSGQAAAVASIPIEKTTAPVVNQTPSRAAAPSIVATTPASGPKTITLTFDDGPNNTYTEKVLTILQRYQVHATFFLIGRNTLNYPTVAKHIAAAGHTIGNHSFTHSDLGRMSRAQVDNEIANTQTAINNVAGLSPTIFRPPYGSLSPTVIASISARRLQLQMWTDDPRDWSQPGASVISQRVINGATPGGNILLHVLYQQTVDALPGIIEGLRARGYQFN